MRLYPGDLRDDSQWIRAERIAGGAVTSAPAGREDYVLWTLPKVTGTRAIRFTRNAPVTDREYAGWLGGVYFLPTRMANLALSATAITSSNTESARLINNQSNDGGEAWSNTQEGRAEPLSAEHPEFVTLIWPAPVTLEGLNALWAGFAECDVWMYTGPAGRHPREATDADWELVRSFDRIENQYPRALGVNWLDFQKPVTTRAIRLRITKASTEGHPHLKDKTRDGRRVWLGELMALAPLAQRPLASAILTEDKPQEVHPPIPIRFTLGEPAVVTLVIDDAAGKRVRNLIAEKPFPAGENTVWWDGQDDIGRDQDAANHGIYSIPGKFVSPAEYRVRGLFHKPIELRYEFSIYNAGSPVWETADTTGGWLTNHTAPQSALFVPADRSATGKAMVYLGSYVAEGGHGLAWVDLNGKKLGGRGWVGGTWTGAPYLARDAGPEADRDTVVYAGAAWHNDLRLTALTTKGDRPVVRYTFASEEEAVITGIAVHNNLLVASLPMKNQLLFVDAKEGKILGTAAANYPRGLAFDAQSRLLVLEGKHQGIRLCRYTLPKITAKTELPAAEIVVGDGLQDPQHVALDGEGNLYVSNRGENQQVKVFSSDGKFLRAIGLAGKPASGPYDPLHMNNPCGLAVDENNHLWVTETDFQPKRVSLWTLDGQFVRAFYGPGEYGGGGTLDPRDKTRFYYHGMEFKLDWGKGTDQIVSILYRPQPGSQAIPEAFGGGGLPETPVYIGNRRYFTNWNHSNPCGGASIAMIWIDKNGLAVPVAAMGRANDWGLLKDPAFKSRWPETLNPTGDFWGNQAFFAWSDLNADGLTQPDEVSIIKGKAGGMTVMDDLAFVVSRLDEKAMRFPVARFTDSGIPVYSLDNGQVLVEGSQEPTSSGGDQALVTSNGWTVLTVAPRPFAPQSMGGARNGVAMWSYPSLWPGLHASHSSPAPTETGELIGTTRLFGLPVTPRTGNAGPLWCINSNQGSGYLFTADGLFVSELFCDNRVGQSWTMPTAQRGMLLNGVSIGGENFWPTMTQTSDGNVYLVDGTRMSLVRVDNLDTIRRLPDQTITLTNKDLLAAQAWMIQREATRQQARGQETLIVEIRPTAPTVDGKLDDWSGASWATVDKRGVGAYFDATTKPYDVSGAMVVAGDRLYIAWRNADKNLLRNSGEVTNAPFKTGGALDVMIGARPDAAGTRTRPVEGDQRLLVTMVKDKPYALLYRAVVPGTTEPVPFSSPWRTITIDRVDDISSQIEIGASEEGNYEVSIPLASLALKPADGMQIRGDIGLLRGNGFQTVQRVYWSNKATGITADVPSEAELTPNLWGTLRFQKAK